MLKELFGSLVRLKLNLAKADFPNLLLKLDSK
jgi:hypothetical protein